ncbi:MAG: hypothetical protein A3F72_05795 [Bacteroidetes bacterium RIFCSPLOWO2_12_FULL_35_15]|nr:MAG: hypothetical protein A3F72_05795 [Bacteroidetes bacterium RIFCSPLOWO2_12_FULL_35_15]
MKTRNNIQILHRMLSKSDQIMNDIVNLTMQISTHSSQHSNKDERSLVTSHTLESNKKEIDEFRNILIKQFKESAGNQLLKK